MFEMILRQTLYAGAVTGAAFQLGRMDIPDDAAFGELLEIMFLFADMIFGPGTRTSWAAKAPDLITAKMIISVLETGEASNYVDEPDPSIH